MAAIGGELFSRVSGQIIYLDYGTTGLWELGELRKKAE